MNTVILSMAYRRYRRSVCRSSRAERKLRKMKDVGPTIKAKPGELESHRISSMFPSKNISSILPPFGNLSNRSVARSGNHPPIFNTTLLCKQAPRYACRELGKV